MEKGAKSEKGQEGNRSAEVRDDIDYVGFSFCVGEFRGHLTNINKGHLQIS